MNYWENIDSDLASLVKDGAVKLSPVSKFEWRQEVYEECMEEIGSRSYGENLNGNKNLIRHMEIKETLTPKLVKVAKEHFGLTVNQTDVYNITRLVRPGDNSEGFRGHFDSHLFTLVTPINIPNFCSIQNSGQLYYFPKVRNFPKNEIKNILQKAYYKRFNSASGFEKLGNSTKKSIDNFSDYRPLLFVGTTTFHGNAPVQQTSNQNRMTILTHFFDPSHKYGIGALMRKLRNR